jgi:hypothetical protein
LSLEITKNGCKGKTEAKLIMMREWANSVYKQYEDRGHYQEPPEGETVDLSLRRYLNADPQKVKIEEDHTEDSMLSEYKRTQTKSYLQKAQGRQVMSSRRLRELAGLPRVALREEMAKARRENGTWTDGEYTHGDSITMGGMGWNIEFEPDPQSLAANRDTGQPVEGAWYRNQ